MAIRMIDVSVKKIVKRTAVAGGRILLSPNTIRKIKDGKTKKGDPLKVAEVAAINAVKQTSNLVPMCHQLSISSVEVKFNFRSNSIMGVVSVSAVEKTGVEMEALVGISIALNTIWDMVKYLEKDKNGQYPNTRITDIRVLKKTKGK